MKKKISLILNGFLLIFGFIGLYCSVFTEDGFMQMDTFLYYTIQSNIFVILIAIVAIIFEARLLKGKSIPNGIYTLRFVGTIAITLTFLVFSIMLTPVLIMQGDGYYLFTLGNLCVHNIVPLLAIFDWCLCGKSDHIGKKEIGFGLLPALCYLIFALTRSFMGLTISGDHVPYFFLDYKKYGWLSISKNGIGVVYWIIILFIALLGMGFAFKKIVLKRKK